MIKHGWQAPLLGVVYWIIIVFLYQKLKTMYSFLFYALGFALSICVCIR